MKERTARAIGTLALPSLVCTAALYTFVVILGQANEGPGAPIKIDEMLWTFAWFGFPVVGALITSKQPGNRIGLILVGIGLSVGFLGVASEYAERALVVAPGSLPLARFVGWVSTWSAGPVIALLILLLVLFPTGKAATKPQRFAVRATLFLVPTFMCANGFRPAPLDSAKQLVRNPYGVEALAWLDTVVTTVASALALLFAASIIGLVVRMRRARGELKQQLRWFAYAGLVFPVTFVGLGFVENSAISEEVANVIFSTGFFLSFMGLAAAIGIAVTKYKLYEIDVLVSKTLVFALLATFVTAVYVAIVVGLGTALRSRGNIALSIGATTLVALAFQPVRARVHQLVNRLVYGQRATPYEVLATLSEQFRNTGVDLPDTMARVLREGTGAASASVLLRENDVLTLVGRSGDDGGAGADLRVPVLHRGEDLGAVSIAMATGDPITQTERKLVEQLASQAGLVLRNVRLRRELQARLDDLDESRQRLVKAQDDERRRLERDLHDGAQQMLVVLKIKASLAANVATSETVKSLVEQVRTGTTEAIEALRSLAHGIYPPLLASDGLAAALRSHVAKISIPTAIEDHGISRYDQQVEAAAYFCILEALQNATKYSRAEQIVVDLHDGNGALSFDVRDDGAGFDVSTAKRGAGTTNMADRVAVLGGTLTIDTAPGGGTNVRGAIPARALQRA